jgi:hypothetical protein
MVKENAKGKNKSKKECARHKYRHILEGITILFSGVGQRKNMVCRPTDPRAGPDGYQQIPM